MSKGSQKHVHKYMQTQLKHVKVWRCALPDCNHWMPPNLDNLLVGRSSICWGCAEKFTLDEIALMDEMPKCFGCRIQSTETNLGEPTSELLQFINEKLRK